MPLSHKPVGPQELRTLKMLLVRPSCPTDWPMILKPYKALHRYIFQPIGLYTYKPLNIYIHLDL